jgi:glycosyltransferase involved in cell wall biosynthesis
VLQENKDRMLAEYELADFIAVPSEHVRKSFLDAGVAKEKIIKIPYGCNVEKFFSKDEKLLNGPMIFLFVGMVSLQKGIYYLLEAWSRLNLSNDTGELHIVGNVTEDASEIVNKYKAHHNIFFHGPVAHDKLSSFYKVAHVFLFPSLQEGLAMVIGEAMAAGLVVVCSPNSGGSELLKNLESGILLENVSTKELYKKITWCLNNPCQVNLIGKKAKAIAKNYSWADYGINVAQKYRELIYVKINK